MLTKKPTPSSSFENIIGLTNTLLAQLNDALKHGTQQEKWIALTKMKYLRQLMLVHYKHMRAKLNISDEDLKMVLKHYIENSPEMRQKIHAGQQELKMHKDELSKLVKNKKSKKRSMNKWIRS